MSTKFSPPRSRIAPPKQCKKAPPPPFPPLPLWPPQRLSGFVDWLDTDPLAYIDAYAYMHLHRQGAAMKYQGCQPLTGYRLCATVELVTPPDKWKVTISAWDQWRRPETIHIATVTIDPEGPFTTGFLQHLPPGAPKPQIFCMFKGH